MDLVYVYDALCGWCYGFAPVIKAFAERYAEEVWFLPKGCNRPSTARAFLLRNGRLMDKWPQILA